MKAICAWCGKFIHATCEHCNGVLISATALGGTFGFYGDSMICLNGESPIVYSQRAIEEMKPTHGICPACAELPRETRDALLAERRTQNPRLPSPADLDAVIREAEIREATAPYEKRGPTGGNRKRNSTRAAPTGKPARTRAAQMNAAQLGKLKERRAHFTPRTPNCQRELCWCGLCHCGKCQLRRAAQFLAATDTERDK